MAAVTNNGNALEFAPTDLQSNYNIVMAAVNKNGNALEYALKYV